MSEAASALRDDEEFAEVLGVDVGTDDVFRAIDALDEDGDRACSWGEFRARCSGRRRGRSDTDPRLFAVAVAIHASARREPRVVLLSSTHASSVSRCHAACGLLSLVCQRCAR